MRPDRVVDPFRSVHFNNLVWGLLRNAERLCTVAFDESYQPHSVLLVRNLITNFSPRANDIVSALDFLTRRGFLERFEVPHDWKIRCDWAPKVVEEDVRRLLRCDWRTWRRRRVARSRRRLIEWDGRAWVYDSGRKFEWNGVAFWILDYDGKEFEFIVGSKCPRCGAPVPKSRRHGASKLRDHPRRVCDVYLVRGVYEE